jgi:hypothetical protein
MHHQSGPEVPGAEKAEGSSTEPADITMRSGPRRTEPTARPIPPPKVVAQTNVVARAPAEAAIEPAKAVIVRVHPLGAQIFDGNKKIAHTAASLKLTTDEKKTLTLYLDGYWPRQVVIDSKSPEVNISMKPKLDAGGAPPVAAAAPKTNEAAPAATEKHQKAQSSAVAGQDDGLLPAL